MARPPGDALVTVGGVNLRAGPSIDCPVIATLGFGTQVMNADDLLELRDSLWRKVATPYGDGYTVASACQGMPAVRVDTLDPRARAQGLSFRHISPRTTAAPGGVFRPRRSRRAVDPPVFWVVHRSPS